MRRALLLAGTIVGALFLNTAAFAAVANDEVTSVKLKEADGTSGQNTNNGSGVKTGHIQDSAVTVNKIANNAVATTKISDGAVTAAKISDGAVTDAKISGPISASKLSTLSQSQVSGLEAALAGKSDVTHNHDTLYQQKYGKIAVVARTGGDYSDPVIAMNDLATWCGIPSTDNPCLLKIMPGVYDIGSGTVSIPSFVDMEGSGENVTKIKGSVNGSIGLGVVSLTAPNVEVRGLSVENNSSGSNGTVAITIGGAGESVRLMNVTAAASGSGNDYAISTTMAGTLSLINVNAHATGGGICAGVATYFGPSVLNMVGGSATASQCGNSYGVIFASGGSNVHVLNGVTVSASASYNNIGVFHGPVIIRNSTVTGSGGSGLNNGLMSGDNDVIDQSEITGDVAIMGDGATQGTYKVAHSKLSGSLWGSNYTCIGAYNASYAALDATCR